MSVRQKPIRLGTGILVCGLLAAAGLAAQAGTGTPSDPAETRREVTEDPMVCKRMAPTGSRIQRRYCLKQSQWDAMREGGQRAANDAIVEESQFGYRGIGPGGTNPY